MNHNLGYKSLKETFKGENFHKFHSLRATKSIDLAFYKFFSAKVLTSYLSAKVSPLNVSHYTNDYLTLGISLVVEQIKSRSFTRIPAD